ncbi:E3 ubiquitin-protein ligase RHA2B-like [Vicia villosa]|uniref:E3 ubiquitin-protein ligase RHA2B-like n=1 Tax=Vicia villosa TaxID=3911 RepID=UPI00273B002A|nr:E3 ubiquitin-protein ligase RHA2B-like [Vicia villosa]
MTLKAFVSLIFNFIGLEEAHTNNDATLPYLVATTSILPNKINQQSSESSTTKTTTSNDVGLCCVCLSMLNNKDEIRVLPCSHEFHKVCVNSWLKGHHKTCPLCRFPMGAEEKSHRAEMFSEEMLIWFSSFHIAGM